jgi:acetyltransferase-like isoleucine patch superfamily enzyme
MNIIHYLKHPFRITRILLYYIFGNTIGRLAYPSYVFRSKYFNGIANAGWEWVTRFFISQKVFGYNRHVPWPCSPRILVASPENIKFDIDDLNNFTTVGNYFQALGEIVIGGGTYIAANVGIITENHDIHDPDKRAGAKKISIGKKCWIGMNSVILPGVILGDHTVVGAGTVVTKSFPEGYCVIVGNPGRKIKSID